MLIFKNILFADRHFGFFVRNFGNICNQNLLNLFHRKVKCQRFLIFFLLTNIYISLTMVISPPYRRFVFRCPILWVILIELFVNQNFRKVYEAVFGKWHPTVNLQFVPTDQPQLTHNDNASCHNISWVKTIDSLWLQNQHTKDDDYFTIFSLLNLTKVENSCHHNNNTLWIDFCTWEWFIDCLN